MSTSFNLSRNSLKEKVLLYSMFYIESQKVCKKKYLSWVYGVDRKILVMPISDPRDRFFYPHHTPMQDSYSL